MQHELTDAELSRRVTRSTFAKRAFFVALGGLAMAILIFQFVTLLQVRHTQQQVSPLVHLITDCTTPGRDCYERGQKATGDAVASINEITLLAIACGQQDGLDSYVEIRDCVMAGLSNHPR